MSSLMKGFFIQRSGTDRMNFLCFGEFYCLFNELEGCVSRLARNLSERQIRRQNIQINAIDSAMLKQSLA
ncbi:Uncharacterised protein [Mycobacterium tuberculosis]|nr:Uncharacterised protein [Mycobacterium tuberculosis]